MKPQQAWQFLCAILLAGLASRAVAQWELDNQHSSVNFVSIKNTGIAEVHRFDSLVGFISDNGQLQVVIDLDSVETLIPIRNERMRALFFNTASFPNATVSATVEPALLEALQEAGTVTTELPVTLSLHGMEKTLAVPVTAFTEGQGKLRVFSSQPLIVQAGDFNLEAGVEALRQVAGLQSISTAVPVTLNLLFAQGQKDGRGAWHRAPPAAGR